MNTPDLSKLFAGMDLEKVFAGADVIPAGVFVVELTRGGIGQSKGGTPRYELRGKIVEGEHAGRTVFDDFYLTQAAMWKTRPMLTKLGITTADQLRRELPAGLFARVTLKIEEHEGTRRNKIADLTLIDYKPGADSAPPPAAVPAPTPDAPKPLPAVATPPTPAPDPLAALVATLTPEERARLLDLTRNEPDRCDAWESNLDADPFAPAPWKGGSQ